MMNTSRPTNEDITLVAAGLAAPAVKSWVLGWASKDENLACQLEFLSGMFDHELSPRPSPDGADTWGNDLKNAVECRDQSHVKAVLKDFMIEAGEAFKDLLRSNYPEIQDSKTQYELILRAVDDVLQRIREIDFSTETLEQVVLAQLNGLAEGHLLSEISDQELSEMSVSLSDNAIPRTPR